MALEYRDAGIPTTPEEAEQRGFSIVPNFSYESLSDIQRSKGKPSRICGIYESSTAGYWRVCYRQADGSELWYDVPKSFFAKTATYFG
jgi:hypothetical protein